MNPPPPVTHTRGGGGGGDDDDSIDLRPAACPVWYMDAERTEPEMSEERRSRRAMAMSYLLYSPHVSNRPQGDN
jgi:hypothetical protein